MPERLGDVGLADTDRPEQNYTDPATHREGRGSARQRALAGVTPPPGRSCRVGRTLPADAGGPYVCKVASSLWVKRCM